MAQCADCMYPLNSFFKESYLQLEYKRYLEEVIKLLEDDEGFKQELDKMNQDTDESLEVWNSFDNSNRCLLWQDLGAYYRHYVQQVATELDNDPEFKKMIANLTDEDVLVWRSCASFVHLSFPM